MRGAASGDLKILLAAAALTIGLTVLGTLLSPPADAHGRGSTFGTGPQGARAAYVLLQQLGYRVERSFTAIADQPLRPDTDLLVIASPAEPPSEADRRALARFVERGGVVLATGLAVRFLPAIADVRGTTRPWPREARRFDAVVPSPLGAGAPEVLLSEEFVPGSNAHPYVAVYTDDDDAGVLAARIGNGHVIWWTGSDPLLNATIDRPNHLELLLNVVGPPGGRRIVFDEHVHGHARSLWSFLAGTPAPAALAQLTLLGIAAWVTFGLRRTPVRPLARPARTSSLEFVEAVAALYRKAGATQGAVEIALARTRRILAARTGLPALADDERLGAAAGSRLGLDAAGVVQTLRAAAGAAARPSLSSRDALALVQQLQDLCGTAHHETHHLHVMSYAGHEGPEAPRTHRE